MQGHAAESVAWMDKNNLEIAAYLCGHSGCGKTISMTLSPPISSSFLLFSLSTHRASGLATAVSYVKPQFCSQRLLFAVETSTPHRRLVRVYVTDARLDRFKHGWCLTAYAPMVRRKVYQTDSLKSSEFHSALRSALQPIDNRVDPLPIILHWFSRRPTSTGRCPPI